MTEHFNRQTERSKRQALRNAAPKPERVLWQHLRRQQLGARFRRQYSVDAYVLDFYAPGSKLAIEIDGDSHFTASSEAYDRERTAHLNRFGIEVLRFTNLDIFENIEGVLAQIQAAVRQHATPSPSFVRRVTLSPARQGASICPPYQGGPRGVEQPPEAELEATSPGPSFVRRGTPSLPRRKASSGPPYEGGPRGVEQPPEIEPEATSPSPSFVRRGTKRGAASR